MKVYSTILQGSEATKENAINWATGFDFSEDDTTEYNRSLLHHNYINTVNGIEIYYDFAADYYFFAESE
jgi:hypothetical protein